MQFDIFFSLSHVPVDGFCPSEAQMFKNFFSQVKAADKLGFETAWLAEAHLSSETQKSHKNPVIPHWEGEVGLMTDFFQVAREIFANTKNIEVGSAVSNILCQGGPIAAAERLVAFLNLHGHRGEKRKLHVGFSGGRFEYMNRPFFVVPRNPLEEAAWPVLKGQIFREACEIFLRLLRGDTLSSQDIRPTRLTRSLFRSDNDWQKVQNLAPSGQDFIEVPNRYDFEKLRIIPRQYPKELCRLVLGSHDPFLQEEVNKILPVQVFNLSITQPEKIEDTHIRMKKSYHPEGGAWQRSYMPRTTFVFINGQKGLTKKEQSQKAAQEADKALGAYWRALEGTLDPEKVRHAADNALIGSPCQIIQQAKERFHPEDRLMLWFDFFNHDSQRVLENMAVFMDQVAPSLCT